jgi:putative phage-type endonuclease
MPESSQPVRVGRTAVQVLPASAPRDQWLAARRNGIGASDVPAILEVSEHSTPWHVYADKLGLSADTAGEAAHWGQVLEEPIAQEWSARNGLPVERVGLARHVDHDWMLTTLDRRVIGCPHADPAVGCALEIKNRNAYVASRWYDGIPDDVTAQAFWQMATTGLTHIHIGVLIGGNTFRDGTVWWEDQLGADIVEVAGQFWHGNVQAGVPPEIDGSDALAELLDRLHPHRDGQIEVDPAKATAIIDAYEQARLSKGDATTQMEAARADMLLLLDSAETALIGGQPAFSFTVQAGRRTTDYDALEANHPAAAAECVTRKPDSRRLHIDKAFRHTREETP